MARTVLPSGLRIVTEVVSTVRSAAFGVWVNVGSRDETLPVAGASHFLEHLLFKGTTKRDAMAISSSIEAVGGEMKRRGGASGPFPPVIPKIRVIFPADRA